MSVCRLTSFPRGLAIALLSMKSNWTPNKEVPSMNNSPTFHPFPAFALDNTHISGLKVQVARTVRDDRRRARVLDKLFARDGLILALEHYADEHGSDIEIDVRRGFAKEHWHRELLKIIDIRASEGLV